MTPSKATAAAVTGKPFPPDSLWITMLKTLLASGSPERLASRALEQLLAALKFARQASIWLYPVAGGELKYYCGSVPNLSPSSQEAGQAHKLAQKDHLELQKRLIMPPGGKTAKTHWQVGIPLACEDKKLGVIIFESKAAKPPATREISLMVSGAELFSVVLCKVCNFAALEEAQFFQQEVLPTLSHEMRALLTLIKGYTSALLLDTIRKDACQVEDYLRIIDTETDNLQQLVSDLLESFKLESGRFNLQTEPVLLARIAEKIVKQISQHTSKHKFIITFIPPKTVISADPQWIEQVFYNLIDNAVKYSPDGGLIVVSGESRGKNIVVSVADQGMGLSPEHLNRLFDKYFRVKSPRHKVTGSGLGLPISRTIVEAHGGKIWAESQLGKGTTLYFALPRKHTSEPHED